MIEAVCIKYIYLYIRIQIYFNRIQYLTYQGMDAYMPSSFTIFFFHALGMSLSGSSYSYHLLTIMFALILTLFFQKPQISYLIKKFRRDGGPIQPQYSFSKHLQL